MNIIGIIVEYNPFHNGHLYHLNKIKEMYPESIIIAVMSGNFTQRGDTSIINKWDKTRISLHYGIDIVIELPYHYSTQSADIFAKGSIKILKELKVDTLIFGSESNDIDFLINTAKNMINNNVLEENIKLNMDSGISYPKAIFKALDNNINTPNDILGITYIKEIIKQKAKIKPICIRRTNDYHGEELKSISSASSIRKALINNIDVKDSVPSYTYKFLKNNLFFLEKYYELLKYKILSIDDLSIYNTVDEGIENRIKKYILDSNTLEELINNIKSKRYTYNKIKRMLTHILVGFTKKDAKEYKNINYIKILGFTNKGQKYLNKIKKNVKIPIITNYNKYKNLLKLDYKSTTIYSLISKDKLYQIKQEYNKPIRK